jgi:hypothetical protein
VPDGGPRARRRGHHGAVRLPGGVR